MCWLIQGYQTKFKVITNVFFLIFKKLEPLSIAVPNYLQTMYIFVFFDINTVMLNTRLLASEEASGLAAVRLGSAIGQCGARLKWWASDDHCRGRTSYVNNLPALA